MIKLFELWEKWFNFKTYQFYKVMCWIDLAVFSTIKLAYCSSASVQCSGKVVHRLHYITLDGNEVKLSTTSKWIVNMARIVSRSRFIK